MRIPGFKIPTILVLTVLFACLRAAMAEESFEAFFIHFAQDRAFGATRIQAPLTVLLDPSEVPRLQEHWSIHDAVRKMMWPLLVDQLAGRAESLRVEADTVTLSQYDPETDGYAFSYVFKRKGGTWYLVEYRDDRPG
jgi:hypothetical protein